MKKLFFSLVLALSVPVTGYAWNGYDYSEGAFVEIGQGNLVRSGETIEFYDFSTGQYHQADVQSVERYGSSVEVEVYDHNSGEYRTLDMDSE